MVCEHEFTELTNSEIPTVYEYINLKKKFWGEGVADSEREGT